MAQTTTSASRQAAATSRVREWHSVTVASRACKSIATGRPITKERPTTQTRAPESAIPWKSSSSMTACAVQGANPSSRALNTPASETEVTPSTSLAAGILSQTTRSSTPLGTGRMSKQPWTA